MAKKIAEAGAFPHEDLFAQIEERKRRKLILPKLLATAAEDMRLATRARDAAYSIVRKWAELADKGKLAGKETSIDDAFLAEVFGQALGYRGVTDNAAAYERERQFFVPGTGPADGVLGQFPPADPSRVVAVIELKGSKTNLDRDKSNGRTPVRQVWDYLNAMPETCPWGIVSNFTTIRLYNRRKGSQTYEQFTLREMAAVPERFNQFYALFEPGGLLRGPLKQPPRAIRLLEETENRQREVGDKLYDHYSDNRLRLIDYLHRELRHPLDDAIRIAQKLLDRILFIAFCEDRDLLPSNLIDRAYRDIPFLSKATNPIWQNFLQIFSAVDKGHAAIGVENGYNGGLFRHDPALDELQLPDEPWATFFHSIGQYDYRDEVNVDVLGHLFEKSITELERLRSVGLFGKGAASDPPVPAMPKSPQRKLFGVYYTPVEFTTAIARYTLDETVEARFAELRESHGISEEHVNSNTVSPALAAYWRGCLDGLKNIKIIDPACGSGAFLIQAYDAMFAHYSIVIRELAHQGVKDAEAATDAVPEWILNHNLYGVDLQPEAVEITQLSLWLRTARRGKTLADLSKNIVAGNSLVCDPAVHPRAMDWAKAFPDVFDREGAGFDCVIGNPPWERLKLQEREFFAIAAPEVAAAVNAADRRKMIAKLEKQNPEIYKRYIQAIHTADQTLAYIRACDEYPLTGKGDINTYALFAELARKIVAKRGRVGLLVPSGIATDKTTAEFFNTLTENQSLIRLYDFENRKRVFPDVDGRFKFSILNFGGREVKCEQADFVFFALDLSELNDADRHVRLSAADMKLMNPNTRTCPILRRRRDAELTRAVYRRVPVLVDKNRKKGGNPWGVKFVRMFDQTNDADKFLDPAKLNEKRYRLMGNRWVRGDHAYLPLYEAKMIQAYDHRAASVEIDEKNWMRQGQPVPPSLVEYQNPEHVALPRWWVDREMVLEMLDLGEAASLLCYKDVTSATNQRTMIAAFVPICGVVNSAPLMMTENVSARRRCCLLANLNSFAYDFVARQKVGGLHLNFFIVEQLPTLPPDAYGDKCPWQGKQTLEAWISERVLKLTCTADDMAPLAKACGFDPPVRKWKPAERVELRAELDAAYFILYGLEREEVVYILNTFQGTRSRDNGQGELIAADVDAAEVSAAGERILEAYDRFRAAIR